MLHEDLYGAERIDDIRRTARDIHRLEIINALDLLSRPAPPRRWTVEPWIPFREVTLISGDGGIGKSTIALQLCSASVTSLLWFGLEVRPGAALYVSCEDDMDEIHYRLEQIQARDPHANFKRLHIVSLAGKDALLAMPVGPANRMNPTKIFEAMERALDLHDIRLLVLDAAADVYGGQENDRAQTRAFIQLLRGLAIRRNCAVILLAHPSVDAMKTGRGYAGSTAWNNSVRSRLYFTRATASDASEPDPDMRVLELSKSNRGKTGQKIFVRWHEGVFVLDGAGESGIERLKRDLKAEAVFLDLLRRFNEQGQNVSASRNQTSASKIFSEHPDARGVSKKQFGEAMQKLLTAGKIKIVTWGPPSTPRSRLVVSDE